MHEIHIHYHFHHEDPRLGEVLHLLRQISRKEDIILADLTTLETQVKANTDVEQSAIVLLNGIASQLAAAKTDPVKIQALADSLNSSAASLSAAIVANTPAANIS